MSPASAREYAVGSESDHANQGLRLEASVQRNGDGWTIRLPVRVEEVHVQKRVVVYEEVEIRREYVEEVAQVDGTIRREELDLRAYGDVDVTQPVHPAAARTEPYIQPPRSQS